MSKIARLRRVPWLLLFEAARATHGHLMDVTSPSDRRRVREILRRSKGMPQNLTEREREDLRRIAGKVDLKSLAGSLVPSIVGRRR